MRPTHRMDADVRDITAAAQDRLLKRKITDEAGIQSDPLSPHCC